MSTPRRPSRLELHDPEGAAPPRLRLTSTLEQEPQDNGGEDRQRAGQLWRGLQASPDDVGADRFELDKMDRALVATRKQLHAARADAAAAKARLAEAENNNTPALVAWGFGLLALASGVGWVHQRRKLRAMEAEDDTVFLSPMMASPSAFPPAVEPQGELSEFQSTTGELTPEQEEADRWIEQARVAMPKPS